MDYTSIHIYGHLLSDDILHEIETDSSMQGNREQDFNLDVSLTAKIDMHGVHFATTGSCLQSAICFVIHMVQNPFAVLWSVSLQVWIIL